VREVFEVHFKANVGNLFAVVADFVVRRFEPSLYQPFLRRQAAYLFEIALEDDEAATGILSTIVSFDSPGLKHGVKADSHNTLILQPVFKGC
jgi:hypothetical protein